MPPHADDVCTDLHILWEVEGRRVEGRGRVKGMVEDGSRGRDEGKRR